MGSTIPHGCHVHDCTEIDPGGYEVFSSPTGTNVWTSGGWTDAKTTTAFPITGLDPGTSFDFAVVTRTDPHLDNLNLVKSDFSAKPMATTGDTGCSQPVIEITGYGPFTLNAGQQKGESGAETRQHAWHVHTSTLVEFSSHGCHGTTFDQLPVSPDSKLSAKKGGGGRPMFSTKKST